MGGEAIRQKGYRMNPPRVVVITAFGALALAALACTSPNVGAVEATSNAAQATIVAGLTAVDIQITPNDQEVTQGASIIQQATIAKEQTAIAAGVAGTLTAAAPVPVPATITLAPTAEPPTIDPATGAVSGKLCYPASVLPALTIYATDVATHTWFQQENPENQTQYTFGGLPAGNYYLFAYTHPGTNNPTSIGIGYTEFVLCGLQASCPDHTMIVVAVTAGATTPNIDICDGYDAPAIPPHP
jgi:hypothetical protein